jgi:hypothetical protein
MLASHIPLPFLFSPSIALFVPEAIGRRRAHQLRLYRSILSALECSYQLFMLIFSPHAGCSQLRAIRSLLLLRLLLLLLTSQAGRRQSTAQHTAPSASTSYRRKSPLTGRTGYRLRTHGCTKREKQHSRLVRVVDTSGSGQPLVIVSPADIWPGLLEQPTHHLVYYRIT